MQRTKRIFTALPGGRIKRVQGRRRGGRRDNFGREVTDQRSVRRAERQAFRASVTQHGLQTA